MATSTPDEFSLRMKVLGEMVAKNIDRTVRQVAIVVDQTLVLATPVDTGRARSNWIVSVNSEKDVQIEPYAGGEGLGVGEAANAQAALDQARKAIDAAPKGSTIYIQNNLPYILRLNDGWSAQAPEGFIEEAVNAGHQAIKKAKIL